MTAFVEECRQEWRRLGVPDLFAEEMATELETDLAEAQADGISAAELLGESDPRRFAANWARERGLVSEPAPQKKRRRIWPWIVVAIVLFVLPPVWLALQTVGSSHATSAPPVQVTPVGSVVIPNFVGMKACHAMRLAVESGLRIRPFPHRRCNRTVVAQRPVRGTLLEGRRAVRTVVKLRLRG